MMRLPVVLFAGFLAAGFGDATITCWTNPVINKPNGTGTVQTSITEGSTGVTNITLQTTQSATTTRTYALPSQTPPGIFTIGTNTGILSIADGEKLEYDTNKNHTLVVTATDSDGTATATVTIKIAKAAQLQAQPKAHPPTFKQTLYQVNIANGSKADTVVIKLRATADKQLDQNNEIDSYSIDGTSNTDTDFKIYKNGTISVAKTLAASRTERYILVVKATDKSTPPLTGTASVNVCVGCKNGEAGMFSNIVIILTSALIGIFLNI